MRNKFFLFLAALLAVANSGARAADTARVLFIGNSFTGVNDLPETFRLLAASAGDVVIKESNTPGGYLLMNHSTNAQTLALIDAGGWDFVVLQEQSQAPAFPESQFQQDVVPYAKALSQRVRQYNPCARIVFYNTWGYKNGDASNCAFFTPLCTYNGMDSMLRLRYRRLSDSNDAIHAPVGPVWRHIRANALAIELYDADERHPSPAGTYAAACALYAVIFGKNPQLATYVGSIPAPNAVFIRGFAKEVAYDSLAYWRQLSAPLPAPTAGFMRFASGLTVTFTNTSLGAGQYQWLFGNGATSTQQSPTYTYPTNGTYTATLIVKNECDVADTIAQTFTIGTISMADASPLAHATLSPNPTTGEVWLRGVREPATIFVSDAVGKVVLRLAVESEDYALSLAALHHGVYVVRVVTSRGDVKMWKVARW